MLKLSGNMIDKFIKRCQCSWKHITQFPHVAWRQAMGRWDQQLLVSRSTNNVSIRKDIVTRTRGFGSLAFLIQNTCNLYMQEWMVISGFWGDTHVPWCSNIAQKQCSVSQIIESAKTKFNWMCHSPQGVT